MIFKNICKLAVAVFLLFSLSACSDKNNSNKFPNTQANIDKVLEEQVNSAKNNSDKENSNNSDENSGSKDTQEKDNVNQDDIQNSDSEKDTQNESPDSNTDSLDEKDSDSEKSDPITDGEESSDTVDYDLTAMGSDMVYATVYQLMMNPKDYVGKTFKISGTYYATFYDLTQLNYHYVVIADAAACCAQGIEFVWDDGSHVYPDEYPEHGTEVEVTGVFETYFDEADMMEYCRLRDASMKILQ